MSKIDFTLLKDCLQYNENTGKFTWIKSVANRIKIGSNAGRQRLDGYINIQFQGKLYFAHRLAWLLTYNKWPEDQIDHINGQRNDNRISNLRVVSRSQNMQNKKPIKNSLSGVTGVTWKKASARWIARIMINKKSIHIGSFCSFEDAIKARKKAESEIFTHARHH